MLPFALWVSRLGARCRLGSTSHGRCNLTIELAHGGSRNATQSPGRGIRLDRMLGVSFVATRGCRRSCGALVIGGDTAERFVDLGSQPEVMEQDGELSGNGYGGAFLGVGSASLGDPQPVTA